MRRLLLKINFLWYFGLIQGGMIFLKLAVFECLPWGLVLVPTWLLIAFAGVLVYLVLSVRNYDV